ncbi:MAG: ECF transporter S component [Clostridia bacterium]|nr:ECF transporter S component [Clostridia bacterium]MBQ5801672.1 ECF transporter S component [Clostridia bacterium]
MSETQITQLTNSQTEGKSLKLKRLLLSETLLKKRASHRIAYVALLTAFAVAANMFFEFKFAEVQFSLTLVVSALIGIIIGPVFGFTACFLGDLLGFLTNTGGYPYYPWVGIAMGCVALISGLVINGIPGKSKGFLFIKLAIVCLLTFIVCTVGINTTAFWLLFSKVDYGTYLVSRLFVQGQIYNSLVNYALLFIAVPSLKAIKPLKIFIS